MIIDAHIHYTPPSLAADLDAFVQAEPFWGFMLAPGPGRQSLQGYVTAGRMIEDIDAVPTLAVAAAWPETQAVFARHGIPCDDRPVPFWEPVSQAAAARGLGAAALARLMAELNEAIGGSGSE